MNTEQETGPDSFARSEGRERGEAKPPLATVAEGEGVSGAARNEGWNLKVHVLTLPFDSELGRFDDEPLRNFLADKELIRSRDHFFTDRGQHYLTMVLTYSYAAIRPTRRPVRRSKASDRDSWRSLLGSSDLPLFNTLREWRGQRARDEGIPPYVITLVQNKVLEGPDLKTLILRRSVLSLGGQRAGLRRHCLRRGRWGRCQPPPIVFSRAADMREEILGRPDGALARGCRGNRRWRG